jgi:tetratricopeptide (TPR) repeat protein
VSVGKLNAAASVAGTYKQLDPLSSWTHAHDAALCFYDGRYEDALEPLRRGYELDPVNPMRQFWYALALSYAGDLDKAFSIIDRAAEATPDNVCTKFGLLLKYGLLKENEKALALLTPDFRKTCERDHQWSYFVGLTLAVGDTKDEALDWLENAANRGFCNYPEFKQNPHLDSLRGEERFKKLLERTKYEWEHFEV